MKILLVDDDPLARRVLDLHFGKEPRLRELGAKILHASDGQRALEVARAESPDLVVTDLLMPRMDGFAFARALRTLPACARTPLIIVSGVYRDPALTAKLVDEVGATFLPKPIQIRDFAGAVVAALRHPERGGGETAATVGGAGDALQGELKNHPLPDVLLGLCESGATGTLHLERGRMRKQIFFSGGHAVGAESNLRQEALGAYLVARKVIDEEQLAHLLGESKTRGQKLGSMLVELGWMNEEDVLNYLEGQARWRIQASLRWSEGQFRFVPGEIAAERGVAFAIDLEPLVFVGLRRTADGEALQARFGQEAPRRLDVLPRLELYRSEIDRVFGPDVVPLVAQAASVGALVDRPDADVILPALEAMVMSGLVLLGTPGQTTAPRAPAPADPLALPRLEGRTRPGEIKRARATLAADPEPDEEFSGEESGIIDLGPGGALSRRDARPRAVGEPADVEREQKRRALLREYLQIHGKSLYEILWVEPQADPPTVRAAYERALARFSPETYESIDLGRDAPKLDEVRLLYRRALEVLSDPAQRRAYDAELADKGGRRDDVDAELVFRQGLALLEAGRFDEATVRIEEATQARPDQAAYHAHLGWARFRSLGAEVGEAAARLPLRHALELDPDLVEGHEFLGLISAEAGNHAAARTHLERTLDLDPRRVRALDALLGVLQETGQAEARERLFRRVIHRLGEREAGLRRRLWRELGDLYGSAGDRASAQIAYEAAARLSPDDLDVQRKVVEMNTGDPTRWRETARALATEWRLHPGDGKPGRALVDLYEAVGRPEAAGLAAAALALRGLADPATEALAVRHRSATLPAIARPIDADVFSRLRHPDEDDELEELFGLLAGEGVIAPFADQEVEVSDASAVAAEGLPPAFGGVLAYVASLISLDAPPVHLRPDLDHDARLADIRPYALVAGQSLLDSTDQIELAFRLGRALAFGTAGRVAGAARPGRLLRPYLLAALSLAGRSTDGDGPEVAEIRRCIEALPPESALRIRELGVRLWRDRPAVNLTAWARAIGRTASRVGLLVSGDLLRVGAAVADEEGPEAMADLIDFALSPEHMDLRDELARPA